MKEGTLAGAAGPGFRRQTVVTASRTLSAAELMGLVLVDSTAGPVTLTLPTPNTIGLGGLYQIVAVTGTTNPVTVVTPTGNHQLVSDDGTLTAVRVASGWLVTVEGNLIAAGSLQSFYQDNPGALGSGTYAESFAVPPALAPKYKLGYLAVRCDFPIAAGESATIRLFRYRKPAPFGAFSLSQITDTFVFNSTFDWSWTYDISANIRNGFDLDPITDSIAVSNVYVSGGGPTMRALRVDFSLATV